MQYEENKVVLRGTISENPEFSHHMFGEDFYSCIISVKRRSGIIDNIPIIFSENRITLKIKKGMRIEFEGALRSWNKIEDGKSKLKIYVFVKKACITPEVEDCNVVNITGFLCKKPVWRTTPLDRVIADFLIAINRVNDELRYCKSAYIPCIIWERNADRIYQYDPGTQLEVTGRIQSREYEKEEKSMEVYELSCSDFKVCS